MPVSVVVKCMWEVANAGIYISIKKHIKYAAIIGMASCNGYTLQTTCCITSHVCDTISQGCDVITQACDAVMHRCYTTTQAYYATTQACDTITQACDAVTQGCDITTQGCDATTQACDVVYQVARSQFIKGYYLKNNKLPKLVLLKRNANRVIAGMVSQLYKLTLPQI